MDAIRFVLLTGDYEHADFASLRAWLADCPSVRADTTAIDEPSTIHYQIVAICQSRPGQFHQDQIESLHRRAPLARLIAILGSWCEGELRSGQPWHGVERVYWYNAIGRLQGMLSQTNANQVHRTLTPAERIERQVLRQPARPGSHAVIIAPRRADYEALADLCQVLKLVPHWQRTFVPEFVAMPELVMLACDDLSQLSLADALPGLRRAWPSARLLALLNFPRGDEIAALRSAGFDAVLGKPLLITDLLNCFGNLPDRIPQPVLAG